MRNSVPTLKPSKLRPEEITLDLSKKAARKVIHPIMPANMSGKMINNSDKTQLVK